jgi:two-component system, OmpR family, alkaline phosphatase synthesis response regulator PhoP
MKKILLVEDLGIDAMLTRMALESFAIPFQIILARDGEEAFQLINEMSFDLLLLDIKMPRVDGFELMGRIQALPEKRTDVIILSGSVLISDRERARRLGALDYVQKAIDYSSFKTELKGALMRHGFC